MGKEGVIFMYVIDNMMDKYYVILFIGEPPPHQKKKIKKRKKENKRKTPSSWIKRTDWWLPEGGE